MRNDIVDGLRNVGRDVPTRIVGAVISDGVEDMIMLIDHSATSKCIKR